MTVNELRIGNFVRWNDEDSIKDVLTVTGINLGGELFLEWDWDDGEHDNTDCDISGIKPIPLTEEWLFKFGFVYHQTLKFWVKNWGKNGVEFIRFDEHYKLFSFQLGTGKYKIINTVHELQNLFFALTGEELTIKQ